MTVGVITDSTAYLPADLVEQYGIEVVPLHVIVDGESHLDGVELDTVQLTAALRAHRQVSTSRPTPEDLAALYRQRLDAGVDEVVSVHLSRELSGTWEAARMAADEVGRVRVVDSRSTVMGLGFAVLAAARAAASGADGAAVEAAAVAAAERTTTLFCVPTLEYLRRGGRIGAAAALVGTALSVKPLLHVANGEIVAWDKVRTTARATARMVDRVREVVGGGTAQLVVHHLDAAEQAQALTERLRERVRCTGEIRIVEVGAVIGAHTGPGVLGVVVSPV